MFTSKLQKSTSMLVGNRRFTWVLATAPCVYVLYLLQRHSDFIGSLHQFTYKLVDVGQSVGNVFHGSSPGAQLDSQGGDGSGPTTITLPHLQELCQATNWTEGLWLQCGATCGPETDPHWCGGLNNDRSRLQSCLRMAIDVGAGAIIPQTFPRHGVSGSVLGTRLPRCSDVWFDFAHLQQAMAVNCPQLGLRADCPEPADGTAALPPPPQPDFPLVHTPHHAHSHMKPWVKGDFRDAVYRALNESSSLDPTSGEPVKGTLVVEHGDVFAAWDYNRSNELATIRWDLYQTVKFRESLLQVGKTIRNSPQLKNGYIGVHLRGEIDWPPERGSGVVQMEFFRQEVARIRETDQGRNIHEVFVSCGDQDAINQFREMLQPLNYTVSDKWTILADRPEELEVIEQSGFDSRGIIDHEVLAGATYFMGVCSPPRPLPFILDRVKLVLILMCAVIDLGEHLQPERRLREDCS